MQYRRPVGTGERLQADNLCCVTQADSLRYG